MKPLAIDLFCGLGGWTEGLLAEGYRVVGFDLERHVYGEAKYPAQLVLQDVLTLHGSQFATADLIVASPPCQEFSYMAMPWSKAKTMAREYHNGTRDRTRLTALFNACFRIQREASASAGRHVPMVVENVCGAQKWVGRARWHYGSFYLWGDVPALMPIVRKHVKVDAFRFDGTGRSFQSASVEGTKVATMGAGWHPPDHPKHVIGLAFNGLAVRNLRESMANAAEGHKQAGSGAAWWRGEIGSKSSKSSARKSASAAIAKIPFVLASHIARAWLP